jgi:AcrR family transcriptional regulator
MSSPSAARGSEVRQRLIAAAVELIPERGWTAVSTRVLADRAGVTPSVVHYHFPSVSAVLNDAVVGGMRQALSEVDGLLDSARTPADAVDAMLALVSQYSGADPTSLLFTEGYLAATRDAELRERIEAVLTEFRERFGRWLASREVPVPEGTAAVLMAAIDGLLLHRGLGAGQDTEAAAAVLRRVVES